MEMEFKDNSRRRKVFVALGLVLALSCGEQAEPPQPARGGSSGEVGAGGDAGSPGAGSRSCWICWDCATDAARSPRDLLAAVGGRIYREGIYARGNICKFYHVSVAIT